MRRRVLYFATALALVACQPTKRGREFVRQEMPELHQAVLSVVGEQRTTEFFDQWTEADTTFYRAQNARLLKIFKNRHIPSVERLFASRGMGAYSTLGEAFGSAHLRQRARGSTLFIDERVYDENNPRGRRPDGLVVRLGWGSLVLLNVFESKLGQHGFDREQAQNYLKVWQESGITIPVNGVRRCFRPNRVFLRVGTSYRPITKVTSEELERYTVLVATREHPDFLGHIHWLPFGSADGRAIAFAWIEALARGRKIAPEHRNFVVPALETPEEIFEYRSALREWVLERSAWPKSHGTAGVEKYLAREMSRRRGQSFAFIHDLDDETRAHASAKGLVPALGPLQRRLFDLSPAEPGALSALEALRANYESALSFDESPTVRALLWRSPHREAWRRHFGVPDEDGRPCGEQLSE